MVYFDVSSHSTNVQIISIMVDEDTTLKDRTIFSPERIAEPLEVCLKSTYISYQSE